MQCYLTSIINSKKSVFSTEKPSYLFSISYDYLTLEIEEKKLKSLLKVKSKKFPDTF